VLRIIRLICVVAPIIFGAFAAWKVMAASPTRMATLVLLATAIPPAYRASGTDKAITDYSTLAGEMTNLRDRFRHAATIDAHKSFAEFDAATKPLLDRLEKARAVSLTPPEWCFRSARKKHKEGHYIHSPSRLRSEAGNLVAMGCSFAGLAQPVAASHAKDAARHFPTNIRYRPDSGHCLTSQTCHQADLPATGSPARSNFL
jgi:hypothetical protein